VWKKIIGIEDSSKGVGMSTHTGPLVDPSIDIFRDQSDRLRPTKPLPTDRVSPLNQLRILRAWASVSNEGERPATVNEVSKTVEMAASTVAMTNPFFSSIGLLQRLAVGTYMPSKDVVAFFNARSHDTAARKLAPAFRDAWFGQLILPKLKHAPMEEQTVVSLLEDAAATGPEQRKVLGFIIDFMAAVGLIEHKGDQIKLTSWYSTPSQLVPTISLDGSRYCVSVRVDSKELAESLSALFISLSELVTSRKKMKT